jgi:wyosine [tRNA(Phe)-imidazoG37] synthetase (radical SAM superfamily)
MKYVFGPVKSRRLGVSLGIDIIPYKLCSFNCVYCECGATTRLTSEVKEYIPADDIIRELDSVLSKSPELDVVTFSGSGEPTLNSGIGSIIDYIKSRYPQYKIAVLTNSTTLHIPEVRRSIIQADLIVPSLDAVSDEVFNRIMKPAPGVNVSDVIEGLVSLRREFKGEICLEIFIIEGVNDTGAELKLLKEAAEKISPDEIHLNSLDRPGTEKWVKPVSPERMQEIKRFFEPLPVRVIGKAVVPVILPVYNSVIENTLILNLSPEPVSAEEIAEKMGERVVDIIRAAERLAELGEAGIIPGDNPGIYRIIK